MPTQGDKHEKTDGGRVLLVAEDDWMAALLRGHLSHAGLEVLHASEARQAYQMARTMRPDCIVCDEDLPDIDGFWVIQRVRQDPSPVSLVPILLMTAVVDDVRRSGVGADLLLGKPINNEEMVAQVEALLELAKRLWGRRGTEAPPSRDSIPGSLAHGAALRGDLAHMSITTVLTVLEMERRTGLLQVQSDRGPDGKRRAALMNLSEGQVYVCKLDGKPSTPIELLRAVLRFSGGRFVFQAQEKVERGSGAGQSLGMLLLEAARLEDEASA